MTGACTAELLPASLSCRVSFIPDTVDTVCDFRVPSVRLAARVFACARIRIFAAPVRANTVRHPLCTACVVLLVVSVQAAFSLQLQFPDTRALAILWESNSNFYGQSVRDLSAQA